MQEILVDDLSVIICGEAGEGVESSAEILANTFKALNYNTLATTEYMSRIRGGCNSSTIRISTRKKTSFINRADILILLNAKCFKHIENRLNNKTIIITSKENLNEELLKKYKYIIFLKELNTLSELYKNTEALGAVIGIIKEDINTLNKNILKKFDNKNNEIIQKNILAAQNGSNSSLKCDYYINLNIKKDKNINEEIIINGNDAISLGCIAGGCNFISAYPMSPGTGILTFLSQNQKEYRIIAQQAEDEISVINMAIGANYSGARSMVTTSGGGFDLMTEGVSLAGMIESPIVIHLGQRPGPATGLPTRTAQEDLELALYSGHGEFPRVIYTPGDLEECFYLSAKAFNIAEKFQIPVFILTDQYLLNSFQNIEKFDLTKINIEKYIIETEENYKRYKLTEDGISPRGIPGNGKGLVVADSDEHDEEGHITEDLQIRVEMVNKRLKKLTQIKNESEQPEFYGAENYKTLIISQGSNKNVIKESIDVLKLNDIAFIHIKQAYPLHVSINNYLNKAEKVIIVENNATSQLNKLIQIETDFKIKHKILKYNGLAFSLEEMTERIKEVYNG